MIEKPITIQLCYLTDGEELFASQMLTVPDELQEKNELARQAADGIFIWLPASKEIASRPQSNSFRHIHSYK